MTNYEWDRFNIYLYDVSETLRDDKKFEEASVTSNRYLQSSKENGPLHSWLGEGGGGRDGER